MVYFYPRNILELSRFDESRGETWINRLTNNLRQSEISKEISRISNLLVRQSAMPICSSRKILRGRKRFTERGVYFVRAIQATVIAYIREVKTREDQIENGTTSISRKSQVPIPLPALEMIGADLSQGRSHESSTRLTIGRPLESRDMVYITGDCHANFHKFSMENFPEQKEMDREDIVIVCGDFGLWHDSASERWWLEWIEQKPFTLVFVDGNHENFDRLYGDEFPVVDFCGGKAHKIRDNLYHLMRGHTFTFGGKSFWCFGGARSHDISDGILDRDDFDSDEDFYKAIKLGYKQKKVFRINHVSWWEQELPTESEMAFGIQTLKRHDNQVDYIVTHCCPQEIASVNGFHEADILTNYFNTVAYTVSFSKWFFGHYHDSRETYTKYVMLYDDIRRVL